MNRRSFRPQAEPLDGRDLPAPLLSIGDAAVAEGHAGRTAVTFTVTLSEASAREVSVRYATADGSAKVRYGDYARAAGTVRFAPGETTKTITILVNGDRAVEADETFAVKLSRAAGAGIADATGVGTILNDDAPPPPPVDPPYVPPYDPPPPPE